MVERAHKRTWKRPRLYIYHENCFRKREIKLVKWEWDRCEGEVETMSFDISCYWYRSVSLSLSTIYYRFIDGFWVLSMSIPTYKTLVNIFFELQRESRDQWTIIYHWLALLPLDDWSRLSSHSQSQNSFMNSETSQSWLFLHDNCCYLQVPHEYDELISKSPISYQWLKVGKF